ncbi:MAG TPA: hypothetical protein VL178_09805 [Pseudomonas sp.]|jgi:hypothetical protein|nr:hypothetical protein [Pseudomonas sp.]
MKMNVPSCNASLLALSFLFISGVTAAASADALAPVRGAADRGACVIDNQGTQEPAIALTASAYDLAGVDQGEVLTLIERFLGNGCSIHEADSQGTSPINVAVLTAEPDLLVFLLQAGAEPEMIISGARPWANGHNSAEFAQLLYQIDPNPGRERIVEILRRLQ